MLPKYKALTRILNLYVLPSNKFLFIIHSWQKRSRPAAPVLAGPVFLKVEMKFNFYKKEVSNKSVGVIFGLVRLIILSYNR